MSGSINKYEIRTNNKTFRIWNTERGAYEEEFHKLFGYFYKIEFDSKWQAEEWIKDNTWEKVE